MKRARKYKKISLISTLLFGGSLILSSLSLFSCSRDNSDETNGDNDSYYRQILDLQSQLESLQQSFEDLTNLYVITSANKDATAEDLNSEINDLNALIAKVKGEINDLESQIEDLEASGKMTAEELEKKKKELEDAKIEAQKLIDSLNAQIAQLEKDKKELEEQVAEYSYVTVELYSDGVLVNSFLNPRNATVIPFTPPTKKGHTLSYWTYGEGTGIVWNFETDVTAAPVTALYAVWTPLPYTVSFNTHEADSPYTNIESQEVIYGTQFDLPYVEKTNYTLSRWFYKGATVKSGPWTIAEDAELECEWGLTYPTVTYDYGYEGYPSTYPASETFEFNKTYKINNGKDPTRTGYTFSGWKNKSDNKPFKSSGTWTELGSVDLIATWTPIKYSINLNPVEEGVYDGETSIQVTYDSNYSLPVCQDVDEGKPFAGWFLGNKQITDSNGNSLEPWTYTENKSLEAKYFHVIKDIESFYLINENPAYTYGLVNDIDFSDVEIEQLDLFEGTLIGLGYSLTGLSFNSDDNNIGLFKEVNNAIFEDISFKSSSINITGEILDEDYKVGLIAAKASGETTFKNGGFASNLINLNLDGNLGYVGGLVGEAETLQLDNFSLTFNILNTNIKNAKGMVGSVVGYANSLKVSSSSTSLNKITSSFDGEVGYVGDLAGKVNDLEVNNSSTNCTLDVSSVNELLVVGGFVGVNESSSNIVNSISNGSITATSNENSVYVGGFIGQGKNNVIANNSVNKAHVTSNSYGGTNSETHQKFEGDAGGFIGLAKYINFVDCYNDGIVEETSIMRQSSYAGGIVGRITNKPTISKCATRSSGQVIGRTYGGGIFGCNDSSVSFDLSNVYNEGIVKDDDAGGSVGGIIGVDKTSSTRLFYVYNIGEVISSTGYAGGLVGNVTKTLTIMRCFNEGIVKASEGVAGGLIGYSYNSSIMNCYSNGTIEGKVYAGGLIGENSASNPSISYSYVAGVIRTTTDSSNGKVGGFIGKCYSSSISNSFVIAKLIGLEGGVNSFVGKHSGTPYTGNKVLSGANLFDLEMNGLDDGVEKVSLETLTAEYIFSKEGLGFNSVVWDPDFDFTSGTYLKLKGFAE